MIETTTLPNAVLIVLVEDNLHQRNNMKKFLNECFPDCVVKTIAHGIEAMNYLLTPVNEYHLVILDGKLETFPRTFITSVNGPDIAAAMKEQHIETPIVLFTNDPAMLARFDEVFERPPEIEKPCRKTNVQAVLTPIIDAIRQGIKQESKVNPDNGISYTPN
jgi:two-component system response regulator QseB